MRFTVLHHSGWNGHPDHFDLMLQKMLGIDDDDTVLKTWSTIENQFPSGENGGSLLKALPDHRRFYLQYEGDVPLGRGQVWRVDEGTLIWHRNCKENIVRELSFQLEGTRLRGSFRIRTENVECHILEKMP